MRLLSLVTLSSLLLTSLARDTENDKICQTNEDPDICTVTIIRNKDHGAPGQPATTDETQALVLDNECNSILDMDCESTGEVGKLCKQAIPEGDTSVELVARDKASTFIVEGVGPGLHETVPIFSVAYGDGEPITDEEGNDDPCTCAKSVHKFGIVDAQVCSCLVKCAD